MPTLFNRVMIPLKWFRGASLTKKIIGLIIVGIVLFFVTIPLRMQRPTYTTDTVKREDIQETISESGNIAANGQVSVSSPATGVIQEFDVDDGDTVAAGDILFKVKAVATPQQQASAYASYTSALSSLTTAQNNKQAADATMWAKQAAYLSAQNDENYKNNHSQNPSTKADYTDLEKAKIDSVMVQAQKDFEAAEQTYKTADAAITNAQAQVKSAYLSYQATQDVTVTAPITGVVENIVYSEGDNVTANASATTSTSGSSSNSSSSTTTSATTGTTPVLYLTSQKANRQSPLIVAQVNEVDYPKIHKGQSVVITLPAVKSKTFSGEVTKVDKVGMNTSSVITFNVYIRINDASDKVAPNMTADVDIKTARHTDVFTVANAAIKPYKGGRAVQVYDPKKPPQQQVRYVPVTVGIKGTDRTEISGDGVTEGTQVVTGSSTTTKSTSGSGGGGPLGP